MCGVGVISQKKPLTIDLGLSEGAYSVDGHPATEAFLALKSTRTYSENSGGVVMTNRRLIDADNLFLSSFLHVAYLPFDQTKNMLGKDMIEAVRSFEDAFQRHPEIGHATRVIRTEQLQGNRLPLNKELKTG